MDLNELLEHPVVKHFTDGNESATFAVTQCHNCKYFILKLEQGGKNASAVIGTCINPRGTPIRACVEKRIRWEMRDDVNLPEE